MKEQCSPEFKVVRMKRKSIALHVLKDGSLEVRAPHRTSDKTLIEFVNKKINWVNKVLVKQSNSIIIPSMTPVETEQLRLKTADLVNDFLYCFNGVKPSKVNIRKQKSVWGTCNKKGIISINLLAGNLPYESFEYIMIHELSHLVHLNHSPLYWKHVGENLPDWKIRRANLKKFRIE